MFIIDIADRSAVDRVTACINDKKEYAVLVPRYFGGFEAIDNMIARKFLERPYRPGLQQSIRDAWNGAGRYGILALGFASEDYQSAVERDPNGLTVTFTPKAGMKGM